MGNELARNFELSCTEKALSVSLQAIEDFNQIYRDFSAAANINKPERSKKFLFSKLDHVFNSMSYNQLDEFSANFFSELHFYTKKVLEDDFNYWLSSKRNNLSVSSFYTSGTISNLALDKIKKILNEKIITLQKRSQMDVFKREDLSFNQGLEIRKVSRILNKEFKKLGILEKLFIEFKCQMHISGFALELSLDRTKWWEPIQGFGNSKLAYAHFDESIGIPKAILYLTNVNRENGPFLYYPNALEELSLTSMQYLVGRSVNYVGTGLNSKLINYYDKSYHQSVSCKKFREHFQMLPVEMRFNSHFGWEVLKNSALEERLVLGEKKLLGKAGTFLAFSGGGLLHRGGLVETGERLALQIIFTPKKSVLKKIVDKVKKRIKN